MIKRLAFTAVCVSGFLFSFPAYAEQTQRRSIIDYCELYSYRAAKYEETPDGAAYDLKPLSCSWTTKTTDGLLYVTTTSGSGNIHSDDLTISDMTITLNDLCANDVQNEWYTVTFILGFSALEYDTLGDNMLSLNSKIKGGEQNATDESFRIFNDVIIPTFTEDMIANLMINGGETLIYSGNYDYYLSYHELSREDREHEYLFVTAKERQ